MGRPERNVWSDHLIATERRCACLRCGARLLRPSHYPDPPALAELIEENDPPAIVVADERRRARLEQTMDTVWWWVSAHRGCPERKIDGTTS